MDIESDAVAAGRADASHAAERVRAWSVFVGAAIASLAGAFVLAATSSISAPDATPVERLGTALGVFGLTAVITLPLLLLVQLAIDERTRRTSMPFGLAVLVRGVTLAVLAGALLGLFGLMSGQIAAAPSLVGAGAAAGLWVGSIGTVLGAVLEGSRATRIASTAVVLVAVVAGFVALVTMVSSA